MAIVKRVFFLAVVFALVIFLAQNQVQLGEELGFRFFNLRASLALSIWLLIAFLLGVTLWFLLELRTFFRLRRTIGMQSSELKKLREENARLLRQADAARAAEISASEAEASPADGAVPEGNAVP